MASRRGHGVSNGRSEAIGRRRVRVGFVGAGWWATANNIPIIAARTDAEIVGVCGKDPSVLEQVAQTFGIPFATTELSALLELDLDGLVVSSSHDAHYEHARAGLLRGLHVLCEKPMALRACEAWELVQLAREHRRHLVVGYGWNYKRITREARRVVKEGRLGSEIPFALCHMASPTLTLFAGKEGGAPARWSPDLVGPDPSTWQDPGHGGGYAHGQVTHSSALLFWITGLRARQVSATVSRDGARVDLYVAARIQFDSGAIATISGAGTLPDDDPFQVDLRIFGSEGALMIDYERERLQLRRHDGEHWQLQTEPGEGAYSCEGPPNRFIDLMQERGENESPGELAARSVELIEAIHRSAAGDGRPVSVHD